MLNLCRGRGIHKQVLRVRGVYDAMDDMHEGMQYCAAMGRHAHQDCRSVVVLVSVSWRSVVVLVSVSWVSWLVGQRRG